MILQDGHGQLGPKVKPKPKPKERRGGNRSYEVQTGMYSTPDPVIMTLQIPNYTVHLNLFENHLAHAFHHTFNFNLFKRHQAFQEDEKGATCFALNRPVLAGVEITIISTG